MQCFRGSGSVLPVPITNIVLYKCMEQWLVSLVLFSHVSYTMIHYLWARFSLVLTVFTIQSPTTFFEHFR